RGEREGVLAVLQGGEGLFERGTGRVGGPRVLVVALAGATDTVLRVGGGLVDRHDHRAGAGVGFLPDVDGACLESVAGGVCNHAPSLRAGPQEPLTTAGDPMTTGRTEKGRRRVGKIRSPTALRAPCRFQRLTTAAAAARAGRNHPADRADPAAGNHHWTGTAHPAGR